MGVALRQFRWLAAGSIPAAFDLRRLGWRLRDDAPPPGQADPFPLLALPAGLALSRWLGLTSATAERRRLTAMLGVDDALQRARLLRLGFGEALGWCGGSLEELQSRIERMAERALLVERQRQIGALSLDLMKREGFVAGRAVGLFPREFELLWRLADEPGDAVSQADILRDVWQLRFQPETNSLAVHVSRLRGKLRLAGLDGLVETTPAGGYRLATGKPLPPWGRPRRATVSEMPLDDPSTLREELGGGTERTMG